MFCNNFSRHRSLFLLLFDFHLNPTSMKFCSCYVILIHFFPKIVTESNGHSRTYLVEIKTFFPSLRQRLLTRKECPKTK